MDGADLCFEIVKRAISGFVYSEAVARWVLILFCNEFLHLMMLTPLPHKSLGRPFCFSCCPWHPRMSISIRATAKWLLSKQSQVSFMVVIFLWYAFLHHSVKL